MLLLREKIKIRSLKKINNNELNRHLDSIQAEILNIKGSASYVRVSQLKKQAIEKLKKVMDYSRLSEYL